MNELVQIGPISPLRQRLLDDMALRRFGPETQRNYLRDVARFATWLQRSPHTATAEDMDRGDLPKTVAVLVEAADEPVDDEARMLDIIAKANEIAVRFHLSKLTRKVEDRLLLVAGQDRAT